MADVKTLLKEARKLIDENNFKEAQECCKNILRKDKQNYLGLVLLGKSLQDSDQAALAFQKAIACKADHPLAWHGLANHYEKKDDPATKMKLFHVYGEILKLPIEQDKVLEIIVKLGQLSVSFKCSEGIDILLQLLSRKDIDHKVKETAEDQLVSVLKCGVPCSEPNIPSVLNIFKEIHPKNPSLIELLCAKTILMKKEFAVAVNEVIELEYFSTNSTLREFLCQHICEKYVQEESFLGLSIESLYPKIINSIENSKWPGILKSMIYYNNKDYTEGFKICVPLINYEVFNKIEAIFVLKCSVQMKKWSIVQKLAMNFLIKSQDNDLKIHLTRYLFLALSKQRKWKEAVDTVEKIPFESLDINEQAQLAECLIELNKECDYILVKLKDTEYYIALKSLELLRKSNFKETVELLQNESTNPLCLFYLGKAYWEIKEYDKSHINLLKSAKINPEHAETFLYLGHYYRYKLNDLEKAKKCYEKSYSLNNINKEIGKNLSELYSTLHLKEADFDLLLDMEKNFNESWISFRLGLHYLNKREWENAIIQFRNVIKKNHNDFTAFECLADAYFSRGSYTSALRAYNKVISLNINRELHCQTRIGYIFSLLTQHNEAISVFEKVLEKEPNSILALKGIAETWMRIAKKKLNSNLYGAARECAQQAVNYISTAVFEHKQYTCCWKIYADILMFITKLPMKYAYVFLKSNNKDQLEPCPKNKLDIFPHAIACYSYIAKLKQQNTSYDLAAAYRSFYEESKNYSHGQVAFNLTIAYLKQKPKAWKNWNLLGKICFNINKYDLAQHCFIKALLAAKKWAMAEIWCNLGTLYLALKQYKIANYCYWRGQSALPSYPASWIGQGLIAEAIREEEAMDLFRHASRLGYHHQSALGYAEWVCRTLKRDDKDDAETKYEIEGLHAIPYAIDLIEWYSVYEPDNAFANTVLGILQERFGLIKAALHSYEKALKNADNDQKNLALLNMGRINLRIQKYDEAMTCYKAITEASLESACGLALSLYKKEQYNESYSAYDTALNWLCTEDTEKADLLVAMAGILYMFKGPDDTKNLLFRSIQISQKKPTAYSLFAICSLGMMHSDQSLSKLALSELQKYDKDVNFSYDIGFLKSYILISNDKEKAIKALSETIHDHPNNPLLWFCMAQYCLQSAEARAKTASLCAQRALYSARALKLPNEPAKMIATASIAEHIAGNKSKALVLAKEGLHMYPQQAEIWAALLFSLLANNLVTDRKQWISAATTHMRRHLEISRPLSLWAGFIEKKIAN